MCLIELQLFHLAALNVTVTKVREDFNLTLLAIPMDKDACSPQINETFDLHQYYETCVVFRVSDFGSFDSTYVYCENKTCSHSMIGRRRKAGDDI